MREDKNKFGKTDEQTVDDLLMYIQNMLEGMDDVERVYKQLFEPQLIELLSRYENEEEIPGYKSLKLMTDVFASRINNVIRDAKITKKER